MFYRDAKSWKLFDFSRNKWIDSGSLSFDIACSGRQPVKPASWVDMPEGAVAAFSGTKIICVGRNYRKHAEELGNDVPVRPLWFSKPPSSIIGPGGTVFIPSGYGRIDYEGELALVIGRRAKNISAADAGKHIGGVTACLDMTARELQKSDGQWTRAKGFDTFLPLASLVAPYDKGWKNGNIEVWLNDKTVQKSDFSAMVFDFETLVSDISQCMTLEPGDLILTGTPEGIGPVKPGDMLKVSVRGPVEISFSVNCGFE